MPITAAEMLPWIETLLGRRERPYRSLEEYLAAIPRLDSLSDVPAGTTVLVRGDVDAKPGKAVGEGDIRLRSMTDTLGFARKRGWRTVVIGHTGRKGTETLAQVATRLGELLGFDVPLVRDWLDEPTLTIRDNAIDAIESSRPGSVLLLENARCYANERVLWDAEPEKLPEIADSLAKLANQFAEKVTRIYVNEALSAGSLDTTATVLPAAMDRVALGTYVGQEFDGPMKRCLRAQLVVFSGLKTDKLDDLAGMIGRGTVEMVFAGGSLAMALKKAAAELDGKQFSLGNAENPANSDKPFFVSRERIEQAKRMISEGRAKGIEFVLPIDFVLQDSRISETIGPDDQQFDVGPKTIDFFDRKVGEFINKHRGGQAVAFYNGVLGMFEDQRFEMGTRRFIEQLKRLKQQGVEVYVGGGEGLAALERDGHPSDVTHCFTAGGTVLNALGSEPVPYLVALSMAAQRIRRG